MLLDFYDTMLLDLYRIVNIKSPTVIFQMHVKVNVFVTNAVYFYCQEPKSYVLNLKSFIT